MRKAKQARSDYEGASVTPAGCVAGGRSSHGRSFVRRHRAHVEQPPSMAIRVDETVRIHEAQILWVVVGRAACRERLRDEGIDLCGVLATQIEQHLDRLPCVADCFWREGTKLGVRQQHDEDGVAYDDARAVVVTELWVARVPEGFVKGH